MNAKNSDYLQTISYNHIFVCNISYTAIKNGYTYDRSLMLRNHDES